MTGYSEQAFIQVSDTGHYHRHLFSPVEMAEVALGVTLGPSASMTPVNDCTAIQGETSHLRELAWAECVFVNLGSYEGSSSGP